jgi:hypothetical protein
VKRKLATPLPTARPPDLRSQVKSYIDRFGWDVAEDEAAWRHYQRGAMERDYSRDEW